MERSSRPWVRELQLYVAADRNETRYSCIVSLRLASLTGASLAEPLVPRDGPARQRAERRARIGELDVAADVVRRRVVGRIDGIRSVGAGQLSRQIGIAAQVALAPR